MNKTNNHNYGPIASSVGKAMRANCPLQPYKLEADKDQEDAFVVHIEGNYFRSKHEGVVEKLDEAFSEIEKKFKRKWRRNIFLYKRWSNYVKLYEPSV